MNVNFFNLCRCENYGFQGLYPFCVGVPTIVPEDSITASIISQVYEDAHEFIGGCEKLSTFQYFELYL